MSEQEERYEESADLTRLAKEILDAGTPELADAKDFKFGVVFTNKKLSGHKAGVCRLLDAAMAFKTKLDFLIVIDKKYFERAKPPEKARTMIHELYHITASNRGSPKLREHESDFCEIPSHDRFSAGVYERIKGDLPVLTKLPFQATLSEIQPLAGD